MKEDAGKKKKRPLFWFYLMLFALLLISFLTNTGNKNPEITWLEFERYMLSQNQVEKIEVVNQSVALIYV